MCTTTTENIDRTQDAYNMQILQELNTFRWSRMTLMNDSSARLINSTLYGSLKIQRHPTIGFPHLYDSRNLVLSSVNCFSVPIIQCSFCENSFENVFFFLNLHGIDESVKSSQMSATEEKCKKMTTEGASHGRAESKARSQRQDQSSSTKHAA